MSVPRVHGGPRPFQVHTLLEPMQAEWGQNRSGDRAFSESRELSDALGSLTTSQSLIAYELSAAGR